MTPTSAFTVKKLYNFTLYPAAFLGTDWNNVLVQAIVDYETILTFADVTALHEQVKPLLPSDVPNDPSKYDWMIVRTANGTKSYLGIPWVNAATIEEVSKSRVEILIDDVDSSSIDNIRQMLAQNGYNNFKITAVEAPV
jgi:hypothetical protein